VAEVWQLLRQKDPSRRFIHPTSHSFIIIINKCQSAIVKMSTFSLQPRWSSTLMGVLKVLLELFCVRRRLFVISNPIVFYGEKITSWQNIEISNSKFAEEKKKYEKGIIWEYLGIIIFCYIWHTFDFAHILWLIFFIDVLCLSPTTQHSSNRVILRSPVALSF